MLAKPCDKITAKKYFAKGLDPGFLPPLLKAFAHDFPVFSDKNGFEKEGHAKTSAKQTEFLVDILNI